MINNLDFKFPCLSLDDADLWKPSKYSGEIIKCEYHTHYYSGSTGTPFKKPICIYLPYGYSKETKYDVMVLLPGMDMPYSCYLSRAHRYSRELYSVQFKNVLDNLIAAKVIKPIILVTLPYYGATTEGHPVMELDGNQLICELRYDLIPYIIQNYSTYAEDTSIFSIQNARDHFGVFGFSYTSTMILKQIMPFDLDIFSWFGASSVFWSDIKVSIDALNIMCESYPINYLYVGCGDSDDAREQTKEMYNTFCKGVKCLPKYGSDFVCLPNTGHDARTYDTAIVNCLLKFFNERDVKENKNAVSI